MKGVSAGVGQKSTVVMFKLTLFANLKRSGWMLLKFIRIQSV